MEEISCAIGYLNNDKTVSFKYLNYISFRDIINIVSAISNTVDVKNALSGVYIGDFCATTDESSRYKCSHKGIKYCLVCNNKYHYVNHVKKWTKATLIFLFNKGRWYVNDTTFMRYDKWYGLSTYMLRNYYDYHHQKLTNIFGFDYCIYEVISHKKSYYMTSILDLYNFLRKEEISSFDIKKVNNDLQYSYKTSLRNVHNREIKIKFIPPSKVIDALKFFNEHSKKIK